ncbi:MAG: serine/threonine protein kinase, partial [Planctomycetes bacterium]|nr:serine/threonine protein kinase [Planctomycetota bacterium]
MGAPADGSVHLQNDTGGAHPDEHRLPRAPDGYVLLSRLGGGGMGEVHLAREDTSERLVAIKFLRFPGSREDFERFRLELRVLANLDHPNIVRVLAPDFNGADPCFAMEYLPGGSLARPTEGAAPMAVDRAVQIARAVALACGVAHAARVIHRDLKPSNILLTADGVPKVVDFGLAKRLGAADPLTRDSGALGTPEYMPPEQISQKNGDLGPCADVYGLGATLYHLLTGRVPFVGHSPEEVVMRVLTDLPQRPRALRPEIPLALEGIVLKCLEKDPADRYPSMAELAADLDRFSTPGQTPLAPRLTRRRRARRWVVRHRNGLTIACAIAALLGVTFVLGRVQSGAKRGVTPAPVRRVELAPVPGTPVLLPSPEITHQEAVRDLRAGRSVVLVGPSGPRVPLAWVLGSGEVVLAPADKEARLSLRTGETGSSILELLPDPGIERYRVRAVIRHDQWIPPRGGAASTPSEIGVVIGHQRVAAAQK